MPKSNGEALRNGVQRLLLLAVTGNETTRNVISGGMLSQLEYPPPPAQRTRAPPERGVTKRSISPNEIELAGPVRRLRSNFINGIKSMPVRFSLD